MSATTERNIAMRTAETDFEKALPLARGVSEPWLRCQALAGAARFAPDERVVKIADEAMAAATECADSYKRVAVTAWPFRALIERNRESQALKRLPEVLELASQIENPVSRSDALFLLWEAFFPTPGHTSVLGVLVLSCNHHWKADYLLRQVVLILALADPKEAFRLAESMREGKYKRQALKRLAEGEKGWLRPFF